MLGVYMSYSLNSSPGLDRGFCREYYGRYEGDSSSLDYSSYGPIHIHEAKQAALAFLCCHHSRHQSPLRQGAPRFTAQAVLSRCESKGV